MRTNAVYLGAIFLELHVNNFMQISVDIQWAHRDKVLRDEPNETFAVLYYSVLIEYCLRQAVCPTDFLPNQLLPKNITDLFLLCGGDFRSQARQRNRSRFTDVQFWTWIDANVGRKMNVCIFCSLIIKEQKNLFGLLIINNPNRFFYNSL